MYSLASSTECNTVQDLGDDLRGLGDRHTRPVKEEIAIRKRKVAFANRLQFAPPRMSLQDGLLQQRALQVETAWRHDQVLRVGSAQLFGGNGCGVFALPPQQQFAVGDFNQLRAPISHRE